MMMAMLFIRKSIGFSRVTALWRRSRQILRVLVGLDIRHTKREFMITSNKELLEWLGDSNVLIPNLGYRYFELLDQDRVKFAHRILIKTGSLIELFTYQKPVMYNLSQKSERSYDKSPNAFARRNDSVFRSKSAIKRIIDGNSWQYGYMPVFVTFTFGEHITSVSEANAEWSLFVKRMHYRFRQKFRYICVIEFQKNGRVHFHCLYFDLPFIASVKDVFSEVWGHGFVNVKAIKEIKHLGGYVSKYLTKDTIDARLVGQKAYFCSRNVEKPKKIRSSDAIDSILSSDTISLTFESDYRSDSYGLVNYKKLTL